MTRTTDNKRESGVTEWLYGRRNRKRPHRRDKCKNGANCEENGKSKERKEKWEVAKEEI